MRLKRLIPGLLMPVLCAAVCLAVSRTGLFFRLYVDLFGYDEVGPGGSFLCFPLLALLTGAVPAVLLSGKERNVWTGWTAISFALFFAAEVLRVLPSGPVDPRLFFLLWIPAVLPAVLFHLFPALPAAAARRWSVRIRGRREAL